jgi:hypothetical protein
MSMTSRDRIELSDDQRRELTGVVRAGRSEQRLALRARIVLHAADGQPTTVIAAAVGMDAPPTWPNCSNDSTSTTRPNPEPPEPPTNIRIGLPRKFRTCN